LTEEGDAETVLAHVVSDKIDLGEDLVEFFVQWIRGCFFIMSALNGNSISKLFGESGKHFMAEVPYIEGRPETSWLFSSCDLAIEGKNGRDGSDLPECIVADLQLCIFCILSLKFPW
jgi:hypothetical protein